MKDGKISQVLNPLSLSETWFKSAFEKICGKSGLLMNVGQLS